MKNYDNVLKNLKEKGIRPSYIRVRVYAFLEESRIHPTIDEIYEYLSKEILTLSKTTVYNTLKLFTEKGLAQSIHIEGNEMRYEALRAFHGHFKCERCDLIYDMKISKLHFEEDIHDFIINHEQVLVTGICPKCI